MIDRYLENALTYMESATRGMDADALRRHRPGKWSSAEILEHLTRTFTTTVTVVERQMKSGGPERRRAKFSEWIAKTVVVNLGHMPTGRKAPEFAVPKGADAKQAVARFRQAIAAMDATISRCETKFGSARIASHPILGPLTAKQWRKFHFIHTRHHAKQVEALRDAGGSQ